VGLDAISFEGDGGSTWPIQGWHETASPMETKSVAAQESDLRLGDFIGHSSFCMLGGVSPVFVFSQGIFCEVMRYVKPFPRSGGWKSNLFSGGSSPYRFEAEEEGNYMKTLAKLSIQPDLSFSIAYEPEEDGGATCATSFRASSRIGTPTAISAPSTIA
jgi:hypothetical protein